MILEISPCLYFTVMTYIPKGHLAYNPAVQMQFLTPITLKKGDVILVNMQSGKLEKVTRGEITIWRQAWVN